MSVDALFFQSNLGVNPYTRLLISSISVAQFLRKAGKKNVLQLSSSFLTKRKQNRRKTSSQINVFRDTSGEFLSCEMKN